MAKRVAKKSVKKKKWVPIVAPKLLGEKPIGESYLGEAQEALERTVKVNLMQVTGDIKSQSAAVRFRISEYKDHKLHTSLIGYNFLPSSIKRMVRRRMTRVDDSLVLSTKDNVQIRIKPMLLTRGKVSKLVEYKLRAALKEELTGFVTKTPYDELFLSVLKNRLQSELKSKFNKIHPVRAILIRVLEETTQEVVRAKPKKPVAVEKKPEEPVVEEKKEEKAEEPKPEEKKKEEEKKPAAKELVKEEKKPAKKEEKKPKKTEKKEKKTETKKAKPKKEVKKDSKKKK